MTWPPRPPCPPSPAAQRRTKIRGREPVAHGDLCTASSNAVTGETNHARTAHNAANIPPSPPGTSGRQHSQHNNSTRMRARGCSPWHFAGVRTSIAGSFGRGACVFAVHASSPRPYARAQRRRMGERPPTIPHWETTYPSDNLAACPTNAATCVDEEEASPAEVVIRRFSVDRHCAKGFASARFHVASRAGIPRLRHAPQPRGRCALPQAQAAEPRRSRHGVSLLSRLAVSVAEKVFNRGATSRNTGHAWCGNRGKLRDRI